MSVRMCEEENDAENESVEMEWNMHGVFVGKIKCARETEKNKRMRTQDETSKNLREVGKKTKNEEAKHKTPNRHEWQIPKQK